MEAISCHSCEARMLNESFSEIRLSLIGQNPPLEGTGEEGLPQMSGILLVIYVKETNLLVLVRRKGNRTCQSNQWHHGLSCESITFL
ncbi:hypothetical protein NPIL_571141 [Nephila pilipes]|uniref:Uncharacterized protein n=1 Tax=Nephila pilipes TaxID=299642 RepID=A0A8X6I983_NEPPI|nr:hypothetical protein NPIL_571141 [Nephila pilipes]